MCEWSHTVQTHVVQQPTIYYTALSRRGREGGRGMKSGARAIAEVANSKLAEQAPRLETQGTADTVAQVQRQSGGRSPPFSGDLSLFSLKDFN